MIQMVLSGKFQLKSKFYIFLILLFSFFNSLAQKQDSIYYQLPEVSVFATSPASSLRLVSAEEVIQKDILQKHPPTSLLPSINTISGVRMEERSPGSYRLSIRGSLLRSPFGVRNVKIYLADFPFTDAGGNTYLNSLDISFLNSLKIIKGPEGSIFGANTGGVILIDPIFKTKDSLYASVNLLAGSFGLFQTSGIFQKKGLKSLFTINYGYQESQGYRNNSAFRRHYIQLAYRLNYHKNSHLKTILLFSDLFYKTPGGLTLSQYLENPTLSRTSTRTLKSAAEQNASVKNKTLFGGISNHRYINRNMKNVISIFGSVTNFQNPFITNFEERNELSLGSRASLETNIIQKESFNVKLDIGGEWQKTSSSIANYGNYYGAKDSIQASNDVKAQQAFVFGRITADLRRRLLLEGSISYNFFNYSFNTTYPTPVTSFQTIYFQPQLLHKIAGSYVFSPNISLRAAVSSGYSSPTLAEIRSSDNVVNRNLQAENGLNYESGLRLRDNKDIISLNINAFYFSLYNAIVRQTSFSGIEYFINAGRVEQPGLEVHTSLDPIKKNNFVLKQLTLTSNLTLYKFHFSSYKVNDQDYSGNQLTGVPNYTSVQTLNMVFPKEVSFYLQHYFSSRIPLNDSNSDWASSYSLLQCRFGWTFSLLKSSFIFYCGVDNLLNEKYSLGNDLNAVGGRYYNPAPARNYYIGLKVQL